MPRSFSITLALVALSAALSASAAGPAKQAKPPTAESVKPPAPPAEPYDFRGAKLGMALAEFRALPFPDLDAANDMYGEATRAGIRLYCTGDKDTGESYDPTSVHGAEAAAGGIDCIWRVPPDDSAVRYSWEDAFIKVGEASSRAVIYSFGPGPDAIPRLRMVSITIATIRFDDVMSALTSKFGAPTKQEETEVLNGIGNKFPSRVALWDNGTSTIYAAERSGQIDTMALVYEHKALSASFEKAMEAAKGPPKI